MLHNLSNEFFHENDNRDIRGGESGYRCLFPLLHDYHSYKAPDCDSSPTGSRLGLRCPTRVADFFLVLESVCSCGQN
jgi:hypothetical protein